jgi:hypothetical protein
MFQIWELTGPHGYSHGWIKSGGADAVKTSLRGSGARRPNTNARHFQAGDVIMSKGTGSSETHVARVAHAEPHPNGMGAPTYTVQHLHHVQAPKVGTTEKVPAGQIDSGSHRKITSRSNIGNLVQNTGGSSAAQSKLHAALTKATGK